MTPPAKDRAEDISTGQYILIVDDTPANLGVLSEYLTGYGFEILMATSGQKALERVEYIKPDIILLDVIMPGLDGFELCRRFKADGNTRDIPIIFMTALTEPEHKIKGFQLGAVDYVTKPLQQEEVLARVKTHLTLRSLQKDLQEKNETLTESLRELKASQAQLLAAEKMAMMGRLAGGVAHELRNPLGIISNAIYYLQSTLVNTGETTEEYLNLIATQIHNAERIVANLLNSSRLRTAEREVITIPTLVRPLLEGPSSLEHGNLVTKVAPDLPPVFVDPLQMRQVLTNLLTNAYQAMPDGAEVTIAAQEKKGDIYLSVSDAGAGMSPETIEKVFDPLFTTKTKGIGLGLVISKSLVEVNGGNIKVESKLGQGSVFTIKLPLHQPDR